ncbi:HTH domain-containing protein [Fulvivirga imtechensis]|nr:HTH domain-containing protein [Fulvivirga imtechensis]
MGGLKYFERTKYLLELIEKERTGRPRELAHKLNVSERTIYRIIEELRIHSTNEITFSEEKKSYIFK